ncbi:MAG TPA: stress response translation initiation inhibitor YciH [Solirubrobacterales bacterium]|nr:stress response translation initiation inhibitor YciH [Solirubrobacterales bacterium]
MGRDSELVWSSDGGDFRPEQKREAKKAKRRGGRSGAAPPPGQAPAGSTIKVKRETSGRKGKTATTISEIPLGEAETKALAKKLKQHCGVGGTARGSSIELQGDHRDKVIAYLEKEGHRAVKAGG